jgi:hypothetical protein
MSADRDERRYAEPMGIPDGPGKSPRASGSGLPWTLRLGVAIDNAEGRWVGSVVKSGWMTDAQRHENAKLIVKCVNAHDALVAALREVVASAFWASIVIKDIPTESSYMAGLRDAQALLDRLADER